MAKVDFQPHCFPALSLPHHRWVVLKTCDMLLLTFMLAAWVMAMPWLMANRKSFWLRWCGRGCTLRWGDAFCCGIHGMVRLATQQTATAELDQIGTRDITESCGRKVRRTPRGTHLSGMPHLFRRDGCVEA